MRRKIFLLLFLFVIFFTSCKKEKGNFMIFDLSSYIVRDKAQNKMSISAQCFYESSNYISGKILSWEFVFYNKENKILLSVESSNPNACGADFDVLTSPAQAMMSGRLKITTTEPYNGDLFNGETPYSVLVIMDVIDEHNNEFKINRANLVNFKEVKEEEKGDE